ncbi:MAG: hypothetical protein V4635_11555 [Bacteroidota bacterium]
MKNVLLILLVFGWFSHYSQLVSNQSGSDCGSVVPPVYTQLRSSGNSVLNLVNLLKHDTCLNKKFSIAFHVVMDSSYQWGGVSQADLDGCINSLNGAFSRICVSFQKCFVDSIANYTYNNWEMTATEALVLPSWNVEDVINIYLVDSIVGFPAGYASSVIVLEKGSASGSVPIHEMGHYFGLPHTWAETGTPNVFPLPSNVGIGSQEYVRRTNCYTNGDGFCDTEADCYPAGFDKLTSLPCKHIPGTVDGYGDYYVPPVDNYMTYFKCGCRFTQEQYNWMAYIILTSKLYLH